MRGLYRISRATRLAIYGGRNVGVYIARHTCTVPSSLPEAIYCPSGDHVTDVTWPEWPRYIRISPCKVITCSCPRLTALPKDHTCTVASAPPEAIRASRPGSRSGSPCHATALTPPALPREGKRGSPVAAFHTCTRPPAPPAALCLPS